MAIGDAVKGLRRVFIDSAPAIYLLEENPNFSPATRVLFAAMQESACELVTSPVTMAEVLVHPIRLGRSELIESYTSLLITGERTTFRPIGRDEAILASELRVRFKLTLTDALQIAVATISECDAILTNDPALQRVTGANVLLLSRIQAEA